jgi:hypothetical protein
MWWKSVNHWRARTGLRVGLLTSAVGATLLLAACSGGANNAQPAARATAGSGSPVEKVQAVVTPTPVTAAAAVASTATPQAAAGKNGKGGKYAGLLPRLDAQQLYTVLQKGKLPVSDGTAVTAATDPDDQLGKAGGYTSRVDFLDTSLAQPGTAWSLADGGAIEVFASEKDAKAAKKALDTANATSPSEHDYLDKTVLLRLANGIAADQQSAYGLKVKRAVVADLKQQYKAASAASPTPAPQP